MCRVPISSVLVILIIGLISLRCQIDKSEPLPNFVVIFIDDMGYADIGPFGSTQHQTPHLDKMAEEGMKLTSFYVGSSVCTPSRASLMTGCFPERVSMHNFPQRVVLFPGDGFGLNPSEITIAEVLKEKGYKTGCFGKWHLGDQPEFLPTNQGFDRYYGIPYSNDMWGLNSNVNCPPLPLMDGTRVVSLIEDMEQQGELCRIFTEQAVQFIRENKDNPFFCYLPHAFIHGPSNARPEFLANADSEREATVEEVDWSTGQVLQTLDELGLAENTLVIFTSDNGPFSAFTPQAAYPLRGAKNTEYEGGSREPTIAWWPGKIHAGSVCDEVATAMDLLPTFANLAGANVPQDRIIDGVDIWPLLSEEPGVRVEHHPLVYYRQGEVEAIRVGDWKLLTNSELYHLTEDISESNDLSGQYPEKVEQLTLALKEYREDMAKNQRPIGISKTARTIVPRAGVEGEEARAPTLSLPRPSRTINSNQK